MAPDSDPQLNSRRYFKIVDRSVDVALSAAPVPLHVLDVGCGDGELLRELIERVPYANQYIGIDPSEANIEAARRAADERLDFVQASPDEMPFPAGHFDLVIASMSFSSWPRQLDTLREIARVLTESGRFVVVDDAKPAEVEALLIAAGFEIERRETIYRSGFVVPQVRAYITGV
jgi:ubiquinone/menaquinone biosynthesis C-methylase UbiE